MAQIHWAQVHQRYRAAVDAASARCTAGHDDVPGALLLDMRPAGVFAEAAEMLPGARWHDPAAVADWRTDLPPDHALVVYCVDGHEVGRATALRLRALGLKARDLQGGIDGWRAAGRPVQARPTPRQKQLVGTPARPTLENGHDQVRQAWQPRFVGWAGGH